ncbi:proteasome subunit beta [Candidatus Woesearchaeota archaeon]|nr:proteasome subunit beta [Candidatus Woesearchaeota archaeon]
MESIQVKKGTTTVGIVCKDGIILAADKRATVGGLIADKKSQKIFTINDRMAITMAGTVSDAQLLYKLIKAELRLKQLRTEREPNVKESANLLAGMIYGNIRKFSVIPGISHFLLAGVDAEGFHLYDLFADGSITEIDDYVSSGSGSVMAYGVLETMYRKDLTVKDALTIAVRSVSAAISRDTGSGEGIDAVSITSEGVKTVFHKTIDTSVKV